MTESLSGTVEGMSDQSIMAAAPATSQTDASAWLDPLRESGRRHDEAVARLYQLLLRATHFEARRRAAALGLSKSSELEDIAQQAADDALVAVLAKLDSFEGRSAFTTWAYKFGIHCAGVAVRQLAWRGREVESSEAALASLHSTLADPELESERSEFIGAVLEGLATLSERQRDVLLSLCVSGVPIDVLATRLSTTRGALYKTLHDARKKLRSELELQGLSPAERLAE